MCLPPLSHFPDLCLLAIFAHIPLSDLIRHIGLVCPNWARVRRDELKRRHTLVLLQTANQTEVANPFGSDLISKVLRDDGDGSPWAVLAHHKSAHFNALLLPASDCADDRNKHPCTEGNNKLTSAFTGPLLDLLPNINYLTIFQVNISALDSAQIVHLIEQYATKLVSLNVEFFPAWLGDSFFSLNETNHEAQASMLALFDSINRLESLRHLTLNGNFTGLSAQPNLTILSRLTTFTVRDFQPTSLLLASLREHATTGHVRVDCLTDLELTELTQLEPQLAARFTRASLKLRFANVSPTDYDATRLFCARFNQLTTLELSNHSMPMTMLARCLVFMSPQLISLSLNLNRIPANERIAQPLCPVASVRLLRLTIRPQSHLDTARLHVHALFPNIQVLDLTHCSRECAQCGYRFALANKMVSQLSDDAELAGRITHCMSLARQPFRQCAALHTIRLRTWNEWQKFGLLPQQLLTLDQL